MCDKIVKLIIHHKGKLVKWNANKNKYWYLGGVLDVVESHFDLDHLSLVNIKAYAKDLGYVIVDKVWTNGESMGDFVQLMDDSKISHIAHNMQNGGTLDIYIDGVGDEEGTTGGDNDGQNDIAGTQYGIEAIKMMMMQSTKALQKEKDPAEVAMGWPRSLYCNWSFSGRLVAYSCLQQTSKIKPLLISSDSSDALLA